MDNGAAGEHVSPERFTATDGVEVALRNPCILTFFADDLEDAAPPFVEVVKISPEADGRLLVSADAQDQSDIASVTLYKDGEPVGQKSHSPYEWTIEKAGDYHSFTALAVDASPAKNQRFSHVSSWSRLGR
jgi:Ser/Thr protein kinase RdoA (MazF antagonist)